LIDFIKFLGTAGARFVVSKQLRSSAGLWCSLGGSNILIDPGPGTLQRCLSSRPRLDPESLDGIVLTHRHIDHSTDMNIMVEAMTSGTFNRKGKVYLPRDALDEEPVLYRYLRKSVEEVVILKKGNSYKISENVVFATPVSHIHGVETYGLKFKTPGGTVSLIADTRPFTELAKAYRSDIIILNVVLYQPVYHKEVQHLDLENAAELIRKINPRLAVLTHFGMTMLKQKPWELASRLSEETGVKVVAAYDGFKLELSGYLEGEKILTGEEVKNE